MVNWVRGPELGCRPVRGMLQAISGPLARIWRPPVQVMELGWHKVGVGWPWYGLSYLYIQYSGSVFVISFYSEPQCTFYILHFHIHWRFIITAFFLFLLLFLHLSVLKWCDLRYYNAIYLINSTAVCHQCSMEIMHFTPKILLQLHTFFRNRRLNQCLLTQHSTTLIIFSIATSVYIFSIFPQLWYSNSSAAIR